MAMDIWLHALLILHHGVQLPNDAATVVQVLDRCIANTTRALRTMVNRSLNMAPGNVVFNRDMLLYIPFLANLFHLCDRRQRQVDESLRLANAKRDDRQA